MSEIDQNDITSDLGLDPSQIDDPEVLAQLDGSQEFPTYNPKDNIFKFFRHILTLKDSTKVANLQDLELGKMRLSMRSNLELAAYADAEGLDVVANYFKRKAEILASTSMGRKGFFLQTSVTQIRKDQKIQMANQQPQKKSFWGKKEPQQNYSGGE